MGMWLPYERTDLVRARQRCNPRRSNMASSLDGFAGTYEGGPEAAPHGVAVRGDAFGYGARAFWYLQSRRAFVTGR
jgi:hypothetical protein